MSADSKTRHPGIYKRGSRYRIVYRVDGRRKVETFRTLDDAVKAKRQREADRDRDDLVLGAAETFEQYARDWLDRYQGKGHGFTENTRDDYRRDLERYAYPKIGHLQLTKIRHRHIADLVAWIASHESPRRDPKTRKRLTLADGTVRRALAPVRSALATAVLEDLIRANPCDGVVMPKRPWIESDDAVKALTREQLGQFLEAVRSIEIDKATEVARLNHDPDAFDGRDWDELTDAETENLIEVDDRWELLFRMLAETGLRWSEVIALSWGDLELDGPKPQLRVRQAWVKGTLKPPKSRHGVRTIPLSAQTAADLRAKWERTLPDDQAVVFQSKGGGYLDHPNTLKRVLKPAAQEIGEPWIGFHTFRHTCASLLIAQGRNLKQVQRVMGHHSAAFTLDRYGHLLDEGVGEPVDIDVEIRNAPAHPNS